MLIFHKERLAYLAVPKTGTSAVERALHRKASAVFRDPPGIKHTNIRGYERKFRKIFDRANLPKVETVAVMREPISWLGSWYRYRQRTALSGHKNSTADVSFDEFVAAYLSDTQPDFAKIGAQSRFLSDTSGQLSIDHLFAYEEFSTFLEFLARRLNHEFALERVNSSPAKELALSDDLRAQLKVKYAQDFDIHARVLESPIGG